MPSDSEFPPIVPRAFAGRWIAWNASRTKIVASGLTLEETLQQAKAVGEPNPILAKVPHVDGKQWSLAELASECAIEGPPDLAERYDHYAHGKSVE